jgi:uncharacterized protein YeeX (DUF496 family)
MSKIGKIVFNIQDEIDRGELTFTQIAIKHGVSYEDVNGIWKEMRETIYASDMDEYPTREMEIVNCDSWYEDQWDIEYN